MFSKLQLCFVVCMQGCGNCVLAKQTTEKNKKNMLICTVVYGLESFSRNGAKPQSIGSVHFFLCAFASLRAIHNPVRKIIFLENHLYKNDVIGVKV